MCDSFLSALYWQSSNSSSLRRRPSSRPRTGPLARASWSSQASRAPSAKRLCAVTLSLSTKPPCSCLPPPSRSSSCPRAARRRPRSGSASLSAPAYGWRARIPTLASPVVTFSASQDPLCLYLSLSLLVRSTGIPLLFSYFFPVIHHCLCLTPPRSTFWLGLAQSVLSGSAPPAVAASPTSPALTVQACIQANKCTYNATKKEYHQQYWSRCLTCKQGDNEGVCQVCKARCHNGHLFGEVKYGLLVDSHSLYT